MRPRFQADADFNENILSALLRREPAIDFQSANTAKLAGLDDRKVLAQAADAGRLLVTHDRKTMPKHFAEFIVGQSSPGVFIVSKKLSIPRVVEDLLLIWAASEADEWINVLISLPL